MTEKNDNRIVFALGFFDCVHIAHRKILDRAKEIAQKLQVKSGAVTFKTNIKKTPAVFAWSDRIEILNSYVDSVISFEFSKDFAAMDKREFLDMLVEKYNAVGFVCGSDYRFGKNAEGDVAFLNRYAAEKSMSCSIVATQYYDGLPISSTLVKEKLLRGDIEMVNVLLGRDYFIKNKVVQGRGIGHLFGFPTANILLKSGVICPKLGVYSTMCDINGCLYRSVTNVGGKPTFSDDSFSVETFIDDFDGDIYDQTITVYFRKYLRGIQKFDSAEKLREQIYKDLDR